jgi:hypothetical protein
MRGDELNEAESLKQMSLTIDYLLNRINDIDEVIEINYNKLNGRKIKNTLVGTGDNR